MTVPKELIWETLVSDSLDSIPEGVETNLSKAYSFFEWREHGAYHVVGSTKSDFLVRCSEREYGAVIAREVATLLDQALEHRLLLLNTIQAGKTPSNSWLLVTIYYWCLFLALALLRLVGKVVTYLPDSEIARLKQIFGSGPVKAPRNGTFMVSSDRLIGTRNDLRYRRLKSNNFHEGLWNSFFSEIDARLKSARHGPASWETRLFSALNFQSDVEKASWLSKLRNVVNYRVGFAYDSVRGKRVPDLIPALSLSNKKPIEEIIQELENKQLSTTRRSIVEQPNEYAEAMVHFGILLTHIVEELTATIWSARQIDSQWPGRRGAFTREFGSALESVWPM